MPHDYVYDQGFSEERARPAGIESLWDPGSQVLLDSLGIAGGWRSDADGNPTWGPTSRPVPQWTRPGVTPVETLGRHSHHH
ncbi:MAG: hypothetical protein ACRDTK_09020 [Mycobacterium sp.]